MVGTAFYKEAHLRYIDDWRNLVRVLKWITYNKSKDNDCKKEKTSIGS